MSVCLNDKCKCITRVALQYRVAMAFKQRCEIESNVDNKARW